MKVDIQEASRPLLKLHKLLRDFPAHPSPKEVHDLRTRARRIEAIVRTYSSDSDCEGHRLRKLIEPVRKAAGKVRDMDVILAKLHQIRVETDGDSLVRLVACIANRREKHLARLHQAIARRGKQARRCIKQYVRLLESGNGEVSPAAPQILSAELDNWPELHADNLHEFRIRAKELRYMLQLLPGVDQERMDALADVKDSAGEWHDWLELHGLAREVLNPAADRQLLQQIAAIGRDKLRVGLNAAKRLRRRGVVIPRAA